MTETLARKIADGWHVGTAVPFDVLPFAEGQSLTIYVPLPGAEDRERPPEDMEFRWTPGGWLRLK